VAQFVKALRHKFASSSPNDVIDIILAAALWSGIEPVFNRKEYHEYFLGAKCGRCLGLANLSISCADCFEIWEPQPPGTFRACRGLYMDCFNFDPKFGETEKVMKTLVNGNWPPLLDLKPGAPEQKTGLPTIRQRLFAGGIVFLRTFYSQTTRCNIHEDTT
jgi:hypothetical protein